MLSALAAPRLRRAARRRVHYRIEDDGRLSDGEVVVAERDPREDRAWHPLRASRCARPPALRRRPRGAGGELGKVIIAGHPVVAPYRWGG